jgi:hypothetical protein
VGAEHKTVIHTEIPKADKKPTVIYDNEVWRLVIEESPTVVVVHCITYSWNKRAY